MLFSHTLPLVLAGKKTQTRRIVKGNHHPELVFLDGRWQVLRRNKPVAIYRVGSTYAVQGVRGQRGLWHDGIGNVMPAPKRVHEQRAALQLGYYPLRIEITHLRKQDVRAISDGDALAEGFDSVGAFLAVWAFLHDPDARGDYAGRPLDRYAAWAITFAVLARDSVLDGVG